MSKKHIYIFIFLCLFPFMLAMTFRAVDDYRFAQHKKMLIKENPGYFPKEPPKTTDWLVKREFTCYKKKKMSHRDSTRRELHQPHKTN